MFQTISMCRIASIVLGFFAITTANAVLSQQSLPNNISQLVTSDITVPEVDAKAWALFEYNSGQLIAGKNADLPHPPASITKLMSNYVVFKALEQGKIDLQDDVSISEKAWRAEGSRMFAKVGSKVKLLHLLKSTIVQSGNDAAIALAEHAAGSELAFTQLMNQAAEQLQLADSYFQNSTGLPGDKHRMSAHDIASLAAAIIRDYPQFYPWYSEKEYTHNEITQYNRNKLLWKDKSVDGLKTGHTKAAGYCLVGTAKRNDQRWVAVVLGSTNEKTREQAVLALLDYAFAAYESVSLLDQQGGVATVPVYLGESDEVILQAVEVVNVVIPKGRDKELVVETQLSPYYQAPIDVGQAMGIAAISLDNKVLAEVPLVAVSRIKQGGWWKRVKDNVRMKFNEYGKN